MTSIGAVVRRFKIGDSERLSVKVVADSCAGRGPLSARGRFAAAQAAGGQRDWTRGGRGGPRSAHADRTVAVIRDVEGRTVQAMITSRLVVLLSLALCWTISVSPGQAQDAEKAFYAGKTVRMIVGSGTGGGYDIFSRLIAPYLAKTLGPTVIVEH